jgi:hypothetical protein
MAAHLPALFSNQRETNLASTVALVEQALVELGHQLAASRTAHTDALHAWRVVEGTATTHVLVVGKSDFPHLRVQSVVMTLDDRVDRAALFTQLLEHNATLSGAAFAVDGDRVLLVSERSTLDLDRSEVLDAIRRVSTCADQHDDVLVARYGGRIGGAAT